MVERRRFTTAFGEFCVIVVGVTVALAADSCYQGWSEGRGLEGYLDRLIVDLETDSASFQFVLDMLDVKDTELAQVARVALGSEAPDSTFFRSLAATQVMGFHTPRTQRATYDDMIATGNLRLIRDPILRTAIVAYYEYTDAQWERIDRRRTEYPEAVYRLDPSRWNAPDFDGAFPELAQQAVDSVRTLGFLNLLTAESTRSAFQRDIMQEMLHRVQELLAAARDARGSL